MVYSDKPTYDELLERVVKLEKATLSVSDLPLRALQDKLELDWQPNPGLLLPPGSITDDKLSPVPIYKQAFPFAAGWTNFGTPYEPCVYSKIGALVVLQGLATKSGGVPAIGDVIGTLPAGFRPSGTHIFGQEHGSAGGADQVDLAANGQVIWAGGGAVVSDFTSLSGIVFIVD